MIVGDVALTNMKVCLIDDDANNNAAAAAVASKSFKRISIAQSTNEFDLTCDGVATERIECHNCDGKRLGSLLPTILSCKPHTLDLSNGRWSVSDLVFVLSNWSTIVGSERIKGALLSRANVNSDSIADEKTVKAALTLLSKMLNLVELDLSGWCVRGVVFF